MQNLIVFWLFPIFIGASHFRGGWITYTPISDNGNHVTIQFTATWAWRWSSMGGNIGSWISTWGSLDCRQGCGTAWSPTSLGTTDFTATAVSSADDWIQGEHTWIANLPKVAVYKASFWSCCWISMNSGGSTWEVSTMLNTLNRPDGKINTSPKSSMSAMIKLKPGVTTQLTVPYSDFDNDPVRCRSPIQSANECGDICNLPPGVTLNGATCTLTFNTNMLTTGWYGVSLMLEDFITASSTVPLSGVVVQFLAYVCGGGSSCIIPPIVIGDRPAGSCVSVGIGSTMSERVVARVGCSGMSMQNIQITAPAGNSIGNMYQLNSLEWAIQFTWTPASNQQGVNIICATATDVSCFASNMHCYNVLAGGQSAVALQNTLSPSGTLSAATLAGVAGQITWKFDFDNGILLNTNPAYIYFYASSGTLLFKMDVTSFPGVTLANNITLSFKTGNTFPAGSYYILMDPNIGTLGGTGGCVVGSSGITSSTFWTFTVPSTPVITTTLATATMPNAAAVGFAVSSTVSAILPVGQTVTTTLAPGVTTLSTISTSPTTTLTTTSTTSTTTTTTPLATASTTTTTTLTTLTMTNLNTTIVRLPTTNCNKNAFIAVIAGCWTGLISIHSFGFFVFLFTITNRN